nr:MULTISPECIES: Crp/Fnr family transcriptional regulator [unclassified Lentimicrobium]
MSQLIKHNTCKDCAVKSSPIFNLNENELDLLCSTSTEVVFQKGEHIIKQGLFTQNIIFVKSGIVKLHIKGPLGKDEILKIDKGPIFVGIPDVFANKTHSYSVSALSEVFSCFIEYKGYQQLIEINGAFALELIKTLSRETVNHYQKCVNKMQKQSHAKFADGLLYFSENIFNRIEFDFPLTRTEFGEYIGATRETVTKLFHGFTEDQLIEVQGKKIKILNTELIKRISHAG